MSPVSQAETIPQPVSDDAASPARGEHLLRTSIWTLVLNALRLGVNLITGILIARALGPVGRGQLTAVMALPPFMAWAFAMGCSQATSFHQARHPEDAGRLIGTWLVLLLPLSVLAILVGEALVPVVLAAQTDATVRLAQVYLLIVVSIILAELVYGVLLGDQDFLFFNLIRFGQPAAVAVAYVALWRLGRLTVETALLATAIPGLAGGAIALGRALRRYGACRPSWPLARHTLWYGIRAHGTNLSDMLNTRLDLLIIPAFLGASSVGLYAVATTVSGLVMTLSAALSVLVLPMAARQGARSAETVIRLTRATFVLALSLALVLGLLADLAIKLVYGAPFEGSGSIVRLLLPGIVLYATAAVIRPALYAANRPFSAAVTYFAGVLITVPGLVIFLRPGGLAAAALVSTIAYACVFVATLLVYSHVTGVSVRRFAPSRRDVASLVAACQRLFFRDV